MQSKANSTSGFIIWLDFTRKTVTENEFLLKRPNLLPLLPPDCMQVVDSDAEAVDQTSSKSSSSLSKIVKNAQDIAAVCRKVLSNVENNVISVAEATDRRPINGKLINFN